MKLMITQPNTKGQIVIPKDVRDKLAIDESTLLKIVLKDQSFSVYPIESMATKGDKEDTYLTLLSKTAGSWSDDKTWEKTRKSRRLLELASSKKRKQTW